MHLGQTVLELCILANQYSSCASQLIMSPRYESQPVICPSYESRSIMSSSYVSQQNSARVIHLDQMIPELCISTNKSLSCISTSHELELCISTSHEPDLYISTKRCRVMHLNHQCLCYASRPITSLYLGQTC